MPRDADGQAWVVVLYACGCAINTLLGRPIGQDRGDDDRANDHFLGTLLDAKHI
jgi:hypothetical protein